MLSLLQSNGKIPLFQIFFGVIVGALAALIYVKIYRPNFIFCKSKIANFIGNTEPTFSDSCSSPPVTKNPEGVVLIHPSELPHVPKDFSSKLQEIHEIQEINEEDTPEFAEDYTGEDDD